MTRDEERFEDLLAAFAYAVRQNQIHGGVPTVDAIEAARVGLRSLWQASRAAACERCAAKEATLSMTVLRLGGMVEGKPTQRINFLQRIDELRRIEAQLERAPAAKVESKP